MEQDAAPAGVVRSLALGRSRDPTGGHYDPSARSSLDRAVSDVGGSDARSGDEPACRKPEDERDEDLEARTRGQKSRDGAPWGAHPSPGCPRFAKRGLSWMRHAALHPLGYRGGNEGPAGAGKDYGLPGAAKNTGDGAWPLNPSRERGGIRKPRLF